MNFLGHCLLCKDHLELITGNFGGDFYKGNLDNMVDVPKHVIDGVRLHRFIDESTDNSAHIREIAHFLQSNEVQRVSYIGIDFLLDHYIATHWKDYHDMPYLNFLNQIYSQVEADFDQLTIEFRYFYAVMKDYGWFLDYPLEPGMKRVMVQYSKRIGFENNLPHALDLYYEHKKHFDTCFKSFMEEVIPKTEKFILSMKGINP